MYRRRLCIRCMSVFVCRSEIFEWLKIARNASEAQNMNMKKDGWCASDDNDEEIFFDICIYICIYMQLGQKQRKNKIGENSSVCQLD